MKMIVVAVAASMVAVACDGSTVEPVKTGQDTCEATGGSWSAFKTKQGLAAEICYRPPIDIFIAERVVRREGVEPSRN